MPVSSRVAAAEPPAAQQRHDVGIPELRITAKDLVAALPVEQHFHAGFLGGAHHAPLGIEIEDCQTACPGAMPSAGNPTRNRRATEIPVWLRADQIVAIASAYSRSSNAFCVVARGEGIETVADCRRRFRVLAPNLADDTDDRRRVESAAETAAGADIADQMGADRGDKGVPQLRDVRGVALSACRSWSSLQ